MEKIEVDETSYWQKVFSQSKVNGGLYLGELMPRWDFKWPQNTWLQKRLEQVRDAEGKWQKNS